MPKSRMPMPSLLAIGLAFEAGLAVIGLALAWATGLDLRHQLWPEPDVGQAVGIGILATIPLLLMLVIMLRANWRPVARLRRLVNHFVHLLFGGDRPDKIPWWKIGLLSLVAGFSEEILFRGVLQPLAMQFTGEVVGLVAVSLLFGLVHAASYIYFVLAAAVGLYLGAIAHSTGEIMSVSVAHALYDFIALACIAWGRRRASNR